MDPRYRFHLLKGVPYPGRDFPSFFFSFFLSFHEDFHERGTVAVPVTGVHAQGQLDLWHNKAVTQSVGGTRVVNFIYDLLESSDSSRFFGGASCLLVKSKGERSNSV